MRMIGFLFLRLKIEPLSRPTLGTLPNRPKHKGPQLHVGGLPVPPARPMPKSMLRARSVIRSTGHQPFQPVLLYTQPFHLSQFQFLANMSNHLFPKEMHARFHNNQIYYEFNILQNPHGWFRSGEAFCFSLALHHPCSKP